MVERLNGLSRDLIIHPGETLREVIEDKGVSQRELALRTGVSEKHVSNVVNCVKSISVSFAKKLEYALGIDISFWVNLQAHYDKELATFNEFNEITNEEFEVLSKLRALVRYLQKHELIVRDNNESVLVIELRKLLNVGNLLQIPEVSQVGACRVSNAVSVDTYIMFAWLRMCDLLSSKNVIDKQFNLEKFKNKILAIKEVMFTDEDLIVPRLQAIFAECGIRFNVVEHFTGAPAHGVIRNEKDGTLSLVMTNRGKFADIFWFTLFHEIGHVINGDVANRLIDYEFERNEAEELADKFARDVLIPPDDYAQFVKEGDYSLDKIELFCTTQRVPSFILIGRLQNDEYLKFSQYGSEKPRYSFTF